MTHKKPILEHRTEFNPNATDVVGVIVNVGSEQHSIDRLLTIEDIENGRYRKLSEETKFMTINNARKEYILHSVEEPGKSYFSNSSYSDSDCWGK